MLARLQLSHAVLAAQLLPSVLRVQVHAWVEPTQLPPLQVYTVLLPGAERAHVLG